MEKLSDKEIKTEQILEVISTVAAEMEWKVFIPKQAIDDSAEISGIVIGTKEFLDLISIKGQKETHY